MRTQEKRIIFTDRDGYILCDLPFDDYKPGNIKETREALARKLQCTPEEIEVRIITGIKVKNPAPAEKDGSKTG